ncbi:MAG: SHOCT domain-containing protein [Chloroflexota bacterium]|nr:SHOCT domain-containing protein [Chloroflexota bacterium]
MTSGSRAKDVLDERYARGELTSEEYRERLDDLR